MTKTKHVAITGAGKGIGAAIAEKFVAKGYRVTMIGRTKPTIDQQAQKLGANTQALVCDVADQQSVMQVFVDATTTFGSIDTLVNNAGAAVTAPFLKTTQQQFQAMFDVNFFGACYCIQAVLPEMLQHDAGRIINIASTSAVKGYKYVSAYSASKHAVLGMTRSVALEISRSKVTINAVCPGFTETAIVEDAIANIMQKTGRSEAQAIAELTKHNPQKRFVQPREIAETVFYLSEHAPLSVNGQAIMVDGGETS